MSTVPQTANFGAGNVNGYITRVTVVPEPGVAASLLAGIVALLGGARWGRGIARAGFGACAETPQKEKKTADFVD